MNAMRKTLLAVAIAALPVLPLQAAVIDHADVNGMRTFQDTNTGRVWLDMDNFFGLTPNAMIAAANAAGFTFATTADVSGLLGTLPLTGGEWPSYKAVMGDAPNRELIWGVYDSEGEPFGWAYADDIMTSWDFAYNANYGNWVPNEGSQFADMNIWAFQTGEARVPEPGMLALLALGLAGLGFSRRKQP